MTTTHCYRDYLFQIVYSPKAPAFVVGFPDIPEIITSADNLNGAFANACEALDLHLESLQKLGKPLPAPKHRMVLQGK